jgi:hypothetical protein
MMRCWKRSGGWFMLQLREPRSFCISAVHTEFLIAAQVFDLSPFRSFWSNSPLGDIFTMETKWQLLVAQILELICKKKRVSGPEMRCGTHFLAGGRLSLFLTV